MLGPDRLIIALLKIVDRLQIAMTTDPTGSYLQREYVFLMGLDGQRYCTFSERMRAVSDLHVQEVELRAQRRAPRSATPLR
jgi:hypothetical protein